MNIYKELKELSSTRKRKLGNNTYLVVRDDGGFGVRLHNTQVVIHYEDRVVLNSGGYKTVTTKERMNKYTTFNICQKNYVWYVNGVTFADNMTIYNNGLIEGKAKDSTEITKLIKKVKQYSKEYSEAFMSGKVGKPGSGDCWGCFLVSKKDGNTILGKDHILNHIKENYYVPSMLTRMFDAGTMCLYVKDVIYMVWGKKILIEDISHDDMVRDQIEKSIYKFCCKELGLAS